MTNEQQFNNLNTSHQDSRNETEDRINIPVPIFGEIQGPAPQAIHGDPPYLITEWDQGGMRQGGRRQFQVRCWVGSDAFWNWILNALNGESIVEPGGEFRFRAQYSDGSVVSVGFTEYMWLVQNYIDDRRSLGPDGGYKAGDIAVLKREAERLAREVVGTPNSE